MVAIGREMVVDDADIENIRMIVLLGVNGKICRWNALPKLHEHSIFVMRCPLRTDDAEGESSGNKSTIDE
jgi:hypothetical protein